MLSLNAFIYSAHVVTEEVFFIVELNSLRWFCCVVRVVLFAVSVQTKVSATVAILWETVW